MSHDEWIIDLSAPAGKDAGLVGGKGANLAQALQAGFSVPHGICVTTAAYRAAVSLDDLLDQIDATPAENQARLLELAGFMRQRLLSSNVPNPILSTIVNATQVLGVDTTAVAVRSSSDAEDLADASFAGQYDSFLNIQGVDDVLLAVRRCWASLWNDRAVLYRASHGMAQRHVAIAVVVQAMVDAQWAGVMFTTNPVTGNRSQTLIEAASGLGEALVSGHVTPDSFLLDASGTVLEGKGCLAMASLAALHDLGRRLQRHFGQPQDVEWAIDHGGKLWITQSRPITTAVPVPGTNDDRIRAYWSVNVYQGLSQPFTPMGSMMIRQRQRGLQNYLSAIGFSTHISDVDGWLFWDITDGICDTAKRARMVAFVTSLDAGSGPVIESLGADSRFPQEIVSSRLRPAIQGKRWDKIAGSLLFPRWARRSVQRRAERMVAGLVAPTHASAAERLQFVESHFQDVCRIEVDLPRAANTTGHLAQQWAAQLLRSVADAADMNAAYRGVPGNPTTEMDLALWQLAVQAENDRDARKALAERQPSALAADFRKQALPRVLQQGVARFLTAYGCRGAAEIDLGVARWADDPTPVLTTLASYRQSLVSGHDAQAHFEQAQRFARQHIDELMARLPLRQILRRWLARFLLLRSRELRGLRELPKLYLMRGFQEIRSQLILIGEDLVSRGAIEGADDVMFLDLREVRSALDGKPVRSMIAQRRAVYARELKRRNVPAVVLSDGTVPASPDPSGQAESGAGTLRGLAGAAGRATGPAKVVFDAANARVEPGEILVCPSTDPGWTPLFLNAAALVSETGGITSHGTTVAREYGIPAVVGVGNATTAIRSGQIISVDGFSGTVTLQPEPTMQPQQATA